MLSIGQNTPAANRGVVSIDIQETESTEKTRSFSGSKKYQKKAAKFKEKRKRIFKKIKKKRRNDVVGTSVAILGLLIILGGLASFFLFGIIGWWVVLTALGGIILGCIVVWAGEEIIGSRMAGLGASILFFMGMFAWLIGVLGVAIYALIVG